MTKRRKLETTKEEYNDKFYGYRFFEENDNLYPADNEEAVRGYKYFIRYYNTYKIYAKFKNMDDAIDFMLNELN